MPLYDPITYTAAQAALDNARENPELVGPQLGLSTQQVLNLVLLATYLRGLPDDYTRFDMFAFYNHKFYTQNNPEDALALAAESCGTVGCAVGHGPVAGVQSYPGESWTAYTERCFIPDGSPLFEFFFSDDWQTKDNTPQGAAARIAYVLAGETDWREYDEDDYGQVDYTGYLL
jgi:hypothetical protein